MSITVQSATASPTIIAPGGGQTTITPSLTDPDKTVTVTVQADGTKSSVQVTIHEPEAFSVNPADVGAPGKVVATVDNTALASIAVGPNGTFILTAA